MSNKQEIIQEIKGLSLHYPKRAMSAQDEARWLSDYAESLEDIAPADVRLVCRMWRDGENKRMPTPGEILAKRRDITRPQNLRISSPDTFRPEHPPIPPEEREMVKQQFQEVVASLAKNNRDYRRIPGETDGDYWRRFWPTREVRR